MILSIIALARHPDLISNEHRGHRHELIPRRNSESPVGRETLQKKRHLSIVYSFLLTAVISGCLYIGGGDESHQSTTTTTLGQELQDLEAARDKGIISESEYQEQRTRLLSGGR